MESYWRHSRKNSMFDLDSFMQTSEVSTTEIAQTPTNRYPTSKNLPQMKGAVSIGLAFERYIAELVASGDVMLQGAAEIVGSVYDSLLRANLAKPPKESPLS